MNRGRLVALAGVVALLAAGGVFAYIEWQEAAEASWADLVEELYAPAVDARRRATAMRVKVELADASRTRPIDVAKYDMPGIVRAAEELSAAAREEASEHTSSREAELLSNVTRRADSAAKACRSQDTFEDCVSAAQDLERFLQTIHEWTLPPAAAILAAPAEAG